MDSRGIARRHENPIGLFDCTSGRGQEGTGFPRGYPRGEELLKRDALVDVEHGVIAEVVREIDDVCAEETYAHDSIGAYIVDETTDIVPESTVCLGLGRIGPRSLVQQQAAG